MHREIKRRWELPRRKPSAALEKADSRLDAWLVRLSNLSQFGLFALTIGTLYFTVIPLYKMATLEELIAKRESQLVEAEKKSAAAQANLDNLKNEVYLRERYELLRMFVHSAGAQCSGLMEPPEESLKTVRLPTEQRYLADNIYDCLLNEFELFKIEEKLKKPDSESFKESVKEVGIHLEKERIEARKNIMEAPSRIAADPSLIEEMGPAERAWYEVYTELKPVFPRENWQEIELNIAIDRTQFNIADKFEKVVRNKIADLLKTVESPARTPPGAS